MRIGIVGCGIAGQAAAIALARSGHDVTIVERFEQARPVGAGLLLQPSGQLALARLGLRDTAFQWGAPVERDSLSLATYRDVRLKPWRWGRVLAHALEQTNDIDEAIANYERLRRPHVRFYQIASRTLTPFFQSDRVTLG